MVAHPHLGVQPQAVARAGVGHPFLRLAEGQGVLGQHVHDDPAVGHAGGLLGMGAQQVLEHFHQHARSALKKRLPVLGPRGHRTAGGVHPPGELGVFHQLLQRPAFKLAERHLPQVLQFDLAHAGEQHVRRLGGPQQGAGEHQRYLRVAELRFQLLQLGAALGAQGQVGAAAYVQPLQVPGGQAMADQMEFVIFHGVSHFPY